MCRYVLATSSSSADRDHNVRLAFGNGLRPQIWPQFVERFKIPNIAEFYGATEGNANIGRISIKFKFWHLRDVVRPNILNFFS